jgi:hypothetical protein
MAHLSPSCQIGASAVAETIGEASRTPASKSATATGAANMMLLLIPFLLAFVLKSHSLLDIRMFRANYQLLACFMHDYENSVISND